MIKLVSAALLLFAVGMMLFGVYRAITAVAAQTAEACVSQKTYDNINSLTLSAIDHAFSDQVMLLYSVWLKDYSPEPKRATAGMANNISAYQRARANALSWQPVICK